MFSRNKIATLLAEFLGTFTLTMAVLSMALRTSFPFFSSVVAGLVIGVMTLLLGLVSGAYFNPAVTIGMWTLRQIETVRAVVYIAVQFLAGFLAWVLAEYLLKQPLRNVANQAFDWRVLIAEALGTLIFVFGFTAAVNQVLTGFRKAFAVGASLTIGMIVAAIASNGILNPAVALGIQSWSFAYVAGPFLGAIVGANLYSLVFAPQPVRAVKKAAVVTKPAAKKKPVTKKKSTRK